MRSSSAIRNDTNNTAGALAAWRNRTAQPIITTRGGVGATRWVTWWGPRGLRAQVLAHGWLEDTPSPQTAKGSPADTCPAHKRPPVGPWRWRPALLGTLSGQNRDSGTNVLQTRYASRLADGLQPFGRCMCMQGTRGAGSPHCRGRGVLQALRDSPPEVGSVPCLVARTRALPHPPSTPRAFRCPPGLEVR